MQRNPLESSRMGRVFARYALPSVIGMVVSSLYTVVDGIFVGRGVGELALGSVNIVYPFIMLQIALAMLVAVGGANHYSIACGRGENEQANAYFTQSVGLLVGISLVINLLSMIFSAPVARMLGADNVLLADAQAYLRWMALFGVIYMPGLGISIFVRNDGAPGREMLGTICGAVANIFLDWLFIMPLGWGIEGAAVASGIGQMISVAIYMTHFLDKKRRLRLRLPRFRWADIRRIVYNGVSSFLMEFSQSVITLSFNWVLMLRMGALGVSAYSIVMYVCSIFNMVLIGVVQGAQPIISYNHGKGNRANEEKIYRLGIATNLTATLLFYGVVWLFGRQLAGIFIPGNESVAAMANRMMRLYFLGFFPIGVSLMNLLFFQSTQRESRSIVIAVLRCIGFVQLALLVLPNLLGETGIYLSLPVGELCNMAVSVWLIAHSRRESPVERHTPMPKPVPTANLD